MSANIPVLDIFSRSNVSLTSRMYQILLKSIASLFWQLLAPASLYHKFPCPNVSWREKRRYTAFVRRECRKRGRATGGVPDDKLEGLVKDSEQERRGDAEDDSRGDAWIRIEIRTHGKGKIMY